MVKAQSQAYITYKSITTSKKLICITPAGQYPFLLKYYVGCASNQFITDGCHILDKLQYSDNLMVEGFQHQ